MQDLVDKFGIEKSEEIAEVLKDFMMKAQMHWSNNETVVLEGIELRLRVEGQPIFLVSNFSEPNDTPPPH